MTRTGGAGGDRRTARYQTTRHACSGSARPRRSRRPNRLPGTPCSGGGWVGGSCHLGVPTSRNHRPPFDDLAQSRRTDAPAGHHVAFVFHDSVRFCDGRIVGPPIESRRIRHPRLGEAQPAQTARRDEAKGAGAHRRSGLALPRNERCQTRRAAGETQDEQQRGTTSTSAAPTPTAGQARTVNGSGGVVVGGCIAWFPSTFTPSWPTVRRGRGPDGESEVPCLAPASGFSLVSPLRS